MPNLARLPHLWNEQSQECRAIVETPKGRRSKFAYDPESQLFQLRSVLAEGLIFPNDFGFIPATLGDDGDPLDVLILMDEPTHVGCLLKVRVIGVIEAEQTTNGKTERNDRLVAVAIPSRSHENIRSLKEVSKALLDQIEDFFVTYGRSRGKKIVLKGRHGPNRAAKLITAGIAKFKQKNRSTS